MNERHATGSTRASDRDEAKALLHRAIASRGVPPFLPGEPGGIAAWLAAERVASPVLRDLARIYGVKRWNAGEFERAYLLGALEAWRRGEVTRLADGWRVESHECPVLGAATLDPRVCAMCRHVTSLVASKATGGSARVEFPQLVTSGDGRCVTRITMPPSR